MEKKEKFISICIPSYNRPDELHRLLSSIDSVKISDVEIVICEDMSPKRVQIRNKVEEFMKSSDYEVKYIENIENMGYDRNLRELISNASGEYIIFMGDDDVFVPKGLDKYIEFLQDHSNLGYVLKTSRTVKNDNSIEEFRYFPETKYFEKGFDSFITLFRKSVFISGFTFKREYALDYMIDKFDSSLLFQLYLLAEITLKYDSAYCDILLTEQYEGGTPFFGSSETEKDLYTPGEITIENSINFVSQYFLITKFMDEKHGIDSTTAVLRDMSKYSYPILSIQRNRGMREFVGYCNKLSNLGLNCTIYFYIYYFGLLLIGKDNCDGVIQFLKRKMGRTPQL